MIDYNSQLGSERIERKAAVGSFLDFSLITEASHGVNRPVFEHFGRFVFACSQQYTHPCVCA